MEKFDKAIEDGMLYEGKFKSLATATMLGLGSMGSPAEVQAEQPNPSGVEYASSTKGMRNSNPGNIEANGNWQQWQGAIGDDGRFIQFADLSWGVRAIARIMQTYKNSHGIDTMRGVVERWAPKVENDTEQYIRNVYSVTKIPPEAKIDLSDHATLRRIIQGIIVAENSIRVEMRDIQSGIDLMYKNFDGSSQ